MVAQTVVQSAGDSAARKERTVDLICEQRRWKQEETVRNQPVATSFQNLSRSLARSTLHTCCVVTIAVFLFVPARSAPAIPSTISHDDLSLSS